MLPPETRRVWEFIKDQPSLAGFILVGGSALTLRLGHRVSEDLDLAFIGKRLPRAGLDILIRLAAQHGFEFRRNDNEAALEQFLQAGMELHDHQQDFVVNNAVKVSFFMPQGGIEKVLKPGSETGVRLAELDELFRSKCLVSALRSKTRDWLDLYLLFQEHGFTALDYCQAFTEAGMQVSCDVGLARLSSGVPQPDDEGYSHLLKSAPSIEVMKEFFVQMRNAVEVQRAKDVFTHSPNKR